METLFKKHRALIAQTQTDIVRDTMNIVDWDKPLVAIKGSRGVGNTTLIRQYIKNKYGVQAGKALYCVLDSMYFTTNTLLDIAERFHSLGGEHLFLDEVHKYPFWSREIKEISDLYPDMRITFSGSSLIQIINADADLSRRVLSYTMEGLSFREYLHFYKGLALPAYKFDELLNYTDEICDKINAVCRPQQMFEEYLRVGYYPFYDGSDEEYYNRIENVINFIVDQELTQFCKVDPAYTRRIKAMLSFLSENAPYEVNIAKLATYLELNKSTVLSYLTYLQRAELIHLLYSDNKSVSRMQKPDKIYLHNPNLFYALGQQSKAGSIQECFVVNQLFTSHRVEYAKERGDFLIDGKITFEVGGSGKTFTQVANVADSYILADRIEFPIGKKIPLWLIGFIH